MSYSVSLCLDKQDHTTIFSGRESVTAIHCVQQARLPPSILEDPHAYKELLLKD